MFAGSSKSSKASLSEGSSGGGVLDGALIHHTTLNANLEDVQKNADIRGVRLDQVGISQFDLPLVLVQKDGGLQTVSALIDLSVGLSAQAKGAHLSRFVEQLAAWHGSTQTLCYDLRRFLSETRQRQEGTSAYVTMAFKYFIDKAAPVSKLSAPMAYQCEFQATLNQQTGYQFTLGLQVPISTLCPCSKAISDFGAHNQRAEIRVSLDFAADYDDAHAVLWIEDLVSGLESLGSCPVYPMLKRVDEKWVTERQYTNAKFVEDVARDVTLYLRELADVRRFRLEVEALESIHGHNAFARHAESR
ncbi:MAG: GTP cyclohydrolase FolE2 [Vampirovibrionales bacterium]|nr:GTP cyclohydrolase FolE2 [Vampirovibrionales bacterium]